MSSRDLVLALLLAVPPWVGFLIYRFKGRIGLSYGYFLGGILAVLAIPWPALATRQLPSAHLGGALLGFTFFLQAHREGRIGIRRLAIGVGGSTFFAWVVGSLLGLDMRTVGAFWGTALLEGSLWLLFSDLGYRATRGRWLFLRMPAAGGLAFLCVTALYHILPLGTPPLTWAASLLAGILLGLVALHQLAWLRTQGIWVEGRGDGLRTALSALELDQPGEGPTLAYAIEALQPMILVNEKGLLLETNTAFSRMVGLPRHQMKGFQIQDLFQGAEAPAWEVLRTMLLKDSHASAPATLVRRDASFLAVLLEAVAFDRNMALVWISDPAPGTLSLRPEGVVPRYGAPEGPDRPEPPRLEARPALEALLPRFRRMLPEAFRVEVEVEPATLLLDPEPLGRIATHLVLHGRQSLDSGKLTMRLSPLELGGRAWARLDISPEGPRRDWNGDVLGLTWLHRTVRECSGLLELVRGPGGCLDPRILLPRLAEGAGPDRGLLDGRTLWIVHGDPALARGLCDAAALAGGRAVAFPGLPSMLAASRASAPPDLLVLERNRALERHRDALGRIKGRAVPTLLLDDGTPLPQGKGAPLRLILLEKPFLGPDFVAGLLALLN